MVRRNNFKRAESLRHELISRQDSIDIIINKLKSKEIFTFVRYGDGDYKMMYIDSVGNIVGGNNRFLVTERFRKELIDSYNIEDNNWLIGTSYGDLSKRSTFKNIDSMKLPILQERTHLLAVGCLMDSFIDDIQSFKLFAEEMRKTSTMLVCNYNHPNLEKAYGEIKVFVQVPKQNSYSAIETWYPKILRNLDKVDKIVFSAGQSSRVASKRLYETSKNITSIDVGSVSDMLIMNTDIVNTIPQRSHLRIYHDRIMKSLCGLLGEDVISKFVSNKVPARRKKKRRR